MTLRPSRLHAAVILALASAPIVRAQEQAVKPSAARSEKSANAGTPVVDETNKNAADPLGRNAPIDEPSYRELAGHLFLPSHLIDDPFSCTSLGVSLGYGNGQAFGPTLVLNPPSIQAEGRLYGYTGLGMGVEMQVRFLDWLSARGSLGAGAYLGNSKDSALIVGTDARLNWDLGMKGSLPVGEHFRFALLVDARYGPSISILLAQGLADALQQCRDQGACAIDPEQFFQQNDYLTWVAGFSGAWAPAPWGGVMLNLQYQNPIKVGTASYAKNGIQVAAEAEFDALPLVR